MTTVALLKYHALGNDFLIALDAAPFGAGAGAEGPSAEDGRVPAELVRRVCDRHRGIGADGLILARVPREGGDAAMELCNADGGRAETSGNGLRCFALALVDSGTVARRGVTIETDGGTVRAEVGARPSGGCAGVSLEMGTARVGEVEHVVGLDARPVRIGNPHLVLLAQSIEGIDLSVTGPPLERAVPGGRNIEAVAPDREGGLQLVVWERGAGLTRACGSGSAAAAAAARASGMVGEHVAVHNPGGTLVVDLEGPLEAPLVRLTGPACRVARVELELGHEDRS